MWRRVRELAEPYEATATSLPEGEIVAEPTIPSTLIVPLMSQVGLSYAVEIGVVCRGCSLRFTNPDLGMVKEET